MKHRNNATYLHIIHFNISSLTKKNSSFPLPFRKYTATLPHTGPRQEDQAILLPTFVQWQLLPCPILPGIGYNARVRLYNPWGIAPKYRILTVYFLSYISISLGWKKWTVLHQNNRLRLMFNIFYHINIENAKWRLQKYQQTPILAILFLIKNRRC